MRMGQDTGDNEAAESLSITSYPGPDISIRTWS